MTEPYNINQRRAQKRREQESRYKQAFDEVIGDPYALGEPLEGNYITLKCRSSVPAIDYDKEGTATPNAAKPSILDFAMDVEKAVRQGLYQLGYPTSAFWKTYIDGYHDDKLLTQGERTKLESKIGKIFLDNHISPVREYFRTIRQGSVK
jgi:hypothetical protein